MNTNRICGVDETSKPYAAWPFPPRYDLMICVEECTNTVSDPRMGTGWNLNSTSFLYYCLPSFNESIDVNIKFSGSFNADLGTRQLGDIWTAGNMILASAGSALVLAIVYTYVCKNCASCLVWGCILLTIGGGGFLSYTLLHEAYAGGGLVPATDSESRVTALKYGGYISGGVTAVFFLAILALRTEISIAIAVVKESAKVMNDIKCLVLFPLLPLLVALAYVAGWIFLAALMYSVGTDEKIAVPAQLAHAPNSNTSLYSHTFDKNYQKYMALHCFGALWNIQFLIYFGYLTIAMAVAQWYFTPQARRKSLDSPILSAVCCALRFHVGTVAFGALVIALVRSVRAVLTYVGKKASSQNPNALQKCVFCCIQCCLKCLECCLDKVSKNAFIWTAIWGGSFCPSACAAFALLWRNLSRVAAVNVVGAYLIGLGKLTVALVNCGAFVLVFINVDKYRHSLSSPVVPCICIFVLSYFITSLFMVIFETVVDTTFLCFLVDCEHNTGGLMMASPSLQKLVDKHADRSRVKAQEMYMLKENVRARPGYDRLDDM